MTTFIYVLTDPRTGETRYIGKSDNPFFRFRYHLSDTRPSYKTAWIQQLKECGLSPHMELLDEVPYCQWQEIEQEYIRIFRALGVPLTNIADGGEGVALKGVDHPAFGRPMSLAERKKRSDTMRGRKLAPDVVARRAQSQRGLKRSPEEAERLKNLRRGKPHSESTRRAMSIARTGMKYKKRKNKCST